MTGAGGGAVAVVPVRGLVGGKTRLAGTLGAEMREALTRRMLRGVVDAALDSGRIDAVAVISPDAAALAFAAALNPRVVPIVQSPAAPGLDAAADAGRDWANGTGAAAMLVLFGDLPLLTAGDVAGLLDDDAPVVLAPDRHGAGTNALVLRLAVTGAGAFRFQYGAGSYARHRAEGGRLDLVVATRVAPGTADDLDTPADWARLIDTREWLGEDLAATRVAACPTGHGCLADDLARREPA